MRRRAVTVSCGSKSSAVSTPDRTVALSHPCRVAPLVSATLDRFSRNGVDQDDVAGCGEPSGCLVVALEPFADELADGVGPRHLPLICYGVEASSVVRCERGENLLSLGCQCHAPYFTLISEVQSEDSTQLTTCAQARSSTPTDRRQTVTDHVREDHELLNPDAIMAAHRPLEGDHWCRTCQSMSPCLMSRMARELVAREDALRNYSRLVDRLNAEIRRLAK